MTLKKSILTLVVFFSINNLFAQNRKYVNEFLNLGVGARSFGMSGAQAASVNDVTSAFWNPAGLMHVNTDFQIGLMHSEYFSSIAKYDYLGVAYPMKNKKGVLGVSLIRFAIDDIPYTLNLIQPDGTVDYSKIKAISAADYAGLISYAQKLKIKKFAERDDIGFNVGGNLKIIHRNVGSMANAWGPGLDFGLQGFYKKWKLGLMLKDITTTHTLWSFSFTEKEKQVLAQTGNEIVSKSSEVNTPRIVLGGGRSFKIDNKMNLLAEVNLDISKDGKRYGNLININPFSIDPKAGLELDYNRLFYVRGGLGNFQRILDDNDTTNTKKRTLFQPTLGVGVKMKSLVIDYAFSSLNLQGNPLYSHFISLRLNINKKNSTYGIANTDLDDKANQINQQIKNRK
ncbi:MAG TPA: PorV/PorQ family protein [Chitinophagaceae bacterium]|nr:PorV/PorQ family protein [Chitinophagaceae bacterium]